MKFGTYTAGVVAMLSIFSAGAAPTVVDLGNYSLTYDDATVLGSTSSSFSSSDGTAGFSWTIPSSVNVISIGGADTATNFALPDFTISAHAGYSLAGPLTGFLGNLVYTQVGTGATTSATAEGQASIDGGSFMTVGGNLQRFETASFLGGTTGYFGSSATVPAGSFTSFSVKDFVLTLNASGGSFASIVAQPQNELKISFLAAAVPEPETYAMMLAGIGLIVTIARRRKKHDA
jgi:hypothetical protein